MERAALDDPWRSLLLVGSEDGHRPRPCAAAVLDLLLGPSPARACSIPSKSEVKFLVLGWMWEMTSGGSISQRDRWREEAE